MNIDRKHKHAMHIRLSEYYGNTELKCFGYKNIQACYYNTM